ncbi:MAG: septum formation initiator family protein [Nitrospirota bacterium]
MMSTPVNRLRQQVVSEKRRRRLVFYTIIFLSFLYLVINIVFGDMGVLKYRDLRTKKINLEREMKEIEQDNTRLRAQIKSLKEDPYYREKHAREDFGLAKPDEYIFQYDR